jgi:hypothetical protein
MGCSAVVARLAEARRLATRTVTAMTVPSEERRAMGLLPL